VALNHNYRLPVDALVNVLSSKRIYSSIGLNLIVNSSNPVCIPFLTPSGLNPSTLLLPMVLSFENLHKDRQTVHVKTPYSYEAAPAGIILPPANSRFDIQYMYIYICIYVYYIYMHIYKLYTYCTYIFMYILYMCLYACIHLCIYSYMDMYIYIYVYVFIYINLRICIGIYIICHLLFFLLMCYMRNSICALRSLCLSL
jgi:hypothetical protein